MERSSRTMDLGPIRPYVISLVLFAVVLCAFAVRLIFTSTLDRTLLLLAFAFLSFLLLTAAGMLLYNLMRKIRSTQAAAEELRKFKEFVFSIHAATSEYSAYETLFRFVLDMPHIQQVTLFYRSEKPLEEGVWMKMTNADKALCGTGLGHGCPLSDQFQECVVKNMTSDRVCEPVSKEFTSGSYVCLPVLHSGHIESVLQLYSNQTNYFNPVVTGKIRTYIDITVPAIQNTRTVRLLSKKAATDKLTNVYNRGFLEPYLENQLEATKLSGQSLAVVMLDIDHFKEINDTWGHGAGDDVLVMFTELALKCVRKSDLMARYGGDEFIIVLPATDLETAGMIAERIRQTLAETPAPAAGGRELPAVTCSIGVAAFPMHGSSREELVKSCDIALYAAKQAGRNKVIVYTNEL